MQLMEMPLDRQSNSAPDGRLFTKQLCAGVPDPRLRRIAMRVQDKTRVGFRSRPECIGQVSHQEERKDTRSGTCQ
jgi:hypothetical protein